MYGDDLIDREGTRVTREKRRSRGNETNLDRERNWAKYAFHWIDFTIS